MRRSTTIRRIACDGDSDLLNFNGDPEDLVLVSESGRLHFLQLTPGEALSVAELFDVPANVACTVDAVVQSQLSKLHNSGQWRATAIAPPLAPAVMTDRGAR